MRTSPPVLGLRGTDLSGRLTRIPCCSARRAVSESTLVNTTSQSTALLSTHPPDTTGLRTLTIPDDDARRRLTPAERLSLTVGLWLLRRSLRQNDYNRINCLY